jgi:flagellar protein FliL
MSKTADKETEKETEKAPKKKSPLVLIIVVTLVALSGGVGATWFLLKDQIQTEGVEEKKPTTFMDLDVFTVNLQPEDGDHYLQVGLTIKILQTKVGEEIKKQMPEVRNRLLLLLSGKKPSEISTADGKQQLSTEITHEIKESLDSEPMKEEIIDVLFTSFVIQ